MSKDKQAGDLQTAHRTCAALAKALDGLAQGTLDVPVPSAAGVEGLDPVCLAAKRLQAELRRAAGELEQERSQNHQSSMEMALGLSESFEVLTKVCQGNLDARVGKQVEESPEELIAQLAKLLNATIENISRQQNVIHELSTPVLQLWDDILVLPVIGLVDSRRSLDIMERLLHQIVEKQARYVIMDITGVDLVDTKTADHFIKVIKAAELLGTTCVLSGIQPAVAQTLVEIGVDLTSILTLRDLSEGLKECLRLKEVQAISEMKIQTQASVRDAGSRQPAGR
ncbi:MAG TPA: STAS domain-containing protein [Myxococcota bacterium]|nr:STAS domain-containing protein [Myxococcota bacterium]HRY95811.1 STAS domain-containing protein [Myxococcota bacterium]HSA23848.1 STAS domain-containing protein [Myxococcota bacterium]